jgi:two-component system sensor histidine kinase MprB
MTLRVRIAAIVVAAVALVIVVTAVIGWVLIRQALLDGIDERLMARQEQFAQAPDLQVVVPDDAQVDSRVLALLPEEPIGVQIVIPGAGEPRHLLFVVGSRALMDPDWTPPGPVTATARLDTVSVGGERYRLLSVELTGGTTVRMFYSLTVIDATLARVGTVLGVTAAIGIALAAILGWAGARAGVRPIARLVAATETVRHTKDLSARVAVGNQHRHDEIGRLTTSMNGMLTALEAANGQQQTLIENASHELRTPLAVLRNDFGRLLRAGRDGRGALTEQERQEVIGELDAQVAALSDLVDEVVSRARGTGEAEPRTTAALRPLVDRAVERTKRINPSVTVTVTGDDAPVSMRPVMLERAIGNLIQNAIQASPDGGQVDVELARRADRQVIEVRDRGHGFQPDEFGPAFDRFYRGQAARARPGSGLGLAIVAQVAAAHQGEVVASQRTGGGAVLTLSWPVA